MKQEPNRPFLRARRADQYFAGLLFLLATTSHLVAAERYFDSNGVRIHYTRQGEGEPVLLIHGFAINASTQWVLPGVFKSLAREYDVIAPDVRGHGQSAKPHDPSQYGMEMVEDAVRLLDELRIEKAHVVGYSMGGLIALKLAATHPDRVLTTTLGGMGLFRPAEEPLLGRLAEALESGRGFEPLVSWLTPPGLPRAADTSGDMANRYLMASNDVPAMAALVRGAFDPKLDISDAQLRAVRVPLLAIVGNLDPFAANVEQLRKRVPGLRVATVPDGDHFNTVFKPLFVTSLKTFLAEHHAGAH
jgi:pimeloyl-ACP methyl ester carboxylesterase